MGVGMDVLELAKQAFQAYMKRNPKTDPHEAADVVVDDTLQHLPDASVLSFVEQHPELVTDEALYSMRDQMKAHLKTMLPLDQYNDA